MTTAEFVAKTFQETNFDTPGRYIWSHIKRHPLYGFLMFLGAFINAFFASLYLCLLAGRLMPLWRNEDITMQA